MSVLSLFMSVSRRDSQIQPNHNAIFKEGWVFKKSSVATQYKKQWMVLTETKLTCYASQDINNNNNSNNNDNKHDNDKLKPLQLSNEASEKNHTFNFSLYRFKLERHSKTMHKFFVINESVTNGSNRVTFKTLTNKECDEWVFKIQEAIISCKLSKYRGDAPLYTTFESALEDIIDMDTDESDNDAKYENDDSETQHSSFDAFRIRSITISSTNYVYSLYHDDNDDDDDDNDDCVNNAPLLIAKQIKIIKPQNTQFIQYVNQHDNNENSKLKFIEKEIIETEETYFHGISTLLNELLIPMFEHKLIDENRYFKQITSSLPNLVAFHDLFLEQLKEAYNYKHNQDIKAEFFDINTPIAEFDKYRSIAEVFNAQNKEEFVKIYTKYIADYKDILDLFGITFRDNEALQSFLRDKRKHMKPLSNYLILPVQRVPRYVLLLKDIKKNTNKSSIDYADIECALQLVEEIAMEINEKKRKIENLSQCLQIQQSLTELTETIVDQKRKFQKQFVFIKKENKRQRQLFVFSDMIIIANKKWCVKQIIKNLRTVDVKYNVLDKNTVFELIYADNKCLYVARSANDINEFQHIVQQNRLELLDYDIAHTKGLGSVKHIRQKIKQRRLSNSNDFRIKKKENMKLIALIQSAYNEYEVEKGKVPTNTQLFLWYCKHKKHIKNAVYSMCDKVIKESQLDIY